MLAKSIRDLVENEITDFKSSRLADLVSEYGPFALKFVQSKWAKYYSTSRPLKISETPALTWGTATYVTPLAFPLSSALYGRIGLVTDFEPTDWRVFDATKPSSRAAYVRWARSQPIFSDLLLTVHSTHANHRLRNQFREDFKIDCVLFNPDQEAEIHTDRAHHVWMAVTDWAPNSALETTFSERLSKARFVVLIDEDFVIADQGIPVQTAARQIESVTENLIYLQPVEVSLARKDPNLPGRISKIYQSGQGYLHVFIKP